jgi:hypothetical protein
MNPAEIKSLVEEVMSQGVSLAWWQSALVLVASGLISAIVALLASYLAKRGELRALNENFEIALTQLKENTRAVKEIEGQNCPSLRQRTGTLQMGETSRYRVQKVSHATSPRSVEKTVE